MATLIDKMNTNVKDLRCIVVYDVKNRTLPETSRLVEPFGGAVTGRETG
jgi:hypothetical protein